MDHQSANPEKWLLAAQQVYLHGLASEIRSLLKFAQREPPNQVLIATDCDSCQSHLRHLEATLEFRDSQLGAARLLLSEALFEPLPVHKRLRYREALVNRAIASLSRIRGEGETESGSGVQPLPPTDVNRSVDGVPAGLLQVFRD